MEKQHLACQKYEALLEDYLEGELGTTEAADVERHVNSCRPCRVELDRAMSASRLLHFAGQLPGRAPDPGPGFARQVMARIRTEEAAQGASLWQPLVSMAWKFAATAAFVLALLLTYSVRGNNASQTEVASVSQPEPNDLFFTPDPTVPPADRDEVLMLVAGPDYGKQ